MSISNFIASLLLTLAIVAVPLLYLRPVTRAVLVQLCPTAVAAEFWLRTADVLALAGSLILVMAFGAAGPTADPIQQLRLTLGLALGGVFVAVVLVSSNVWRSVAAAQAPARSAARLP